MIHPTPTQSAAHVAAQIMLDAFSEEKMRSYHNAVADAFTDNDRTSQRGTRMVWEMQAEFKKAREAALANLKGAQ